MGKKACLMKITCPQLGCPCPHFFQMQRNGRSNAAQQAHWNGRPPNFDENPSIADTHSTRSDPLPPPVRNAKPFQRRMPCGMPIVNCNLRWSTKTNGTWVGLSAAHTDGLPDRKTNHCNLDASFHILHDLPGVLPNYKKKMGKV